MSNLPSPSERAFAIGQAFVGPQVGARRFLSAAMVLCVFLGCLFLARVGTLFTRALAASLILLSVFAAYRWLAGLRRAEKDTEGALNLSLARLDQDLAGKVARAYRLYRSSLASDPSVQSSKELAELHASRLLGRVDLTQVDEFSARSRLKKMRLALLSFCGAAIVLLFWSLHLFEGLNVLLAKDGVGPFPVNYVKGLEIIAEWPSYLDGTGQRRRLHSALAGVPKGSEIEVRVRPFVANRLLFLSDGKARVPFVSDGQGYLVARWVADNPAGLKVGARFGDVVLYDAHQTRLQPLDDRAPVVTLAGAPQTLELAELERLELTFVAHDDHGLSQVDLVLSSGQRNVRSELVRLDGQTRMYRGGTALTREHELLRRAFLPVHIRVEARDSNTATGPTWGTSPEIILLPEPLGQGVARRHIALRAFRRQISAFVATEHEAAYKDREAQAEQREQALGKLNEAADQLREQLSVDPSVPQRSLAFLTAQVEALSRRGNERADPTSVLLAVDALIQGLSSREATALAKDLGQSVEEIAVQARQLRFDPGSLSMDGVFDLLSGNKSGAMQLREVGVLGLDLGSVAASDLLRIERNIKERAFDRAEAAALHLAQRLKRATPSFSSSGGAGVESGSPGQGQGSPGGSGSGGPASDAPSEFDKLAQQLGDLAKDGASELTELERLLEQAQEALKNDFETSPELDDALSELKDALSELPQVGRGSGSASSEAASARSQGESMIESLERRELKEAVERGRDAEQAIKRARDLLDQGFGFMDGLRLKRAEDAVSRAIEQAERAVRAQESASAQIDEQARRERAARQRELADRAKQIREKGKSPHSALPGEKLGHLDRAARLLEQAAQALDSGQAEQSRNLAEEAQGHIEQASFDMRERETKEQQSGDSDGQDMSLGGEVPDQDKNRARDFRERIENGLGRGSGRLAPAVRRYAEDLK